MGIADVMRPQANDERRPLLLDRRHATWSRPEGRDHEDGEAKQQRGEQARAPEKASPNLNGGAALCLTTTLGLRLRW